MSRVKFVAVAVILIGFATGSASAGTLGGRWSMRLASGSQTVVKDSVGGSDMVLRGSFNEVPGAVGRAINFNFVSRPSFGTVQPSGQFNPGLARFAVAVYLSTPTVPTNGKYSPNVVQKGLYVGGQWKMQLKGSRQGTFAACRFKGTLRGDTVEDRRRTRLNDRHWHEVLCWRQSGKYGITVDGVSSAVMGSVGAIRTSDPFRVGNKLPTAGVEDQFTGSVDCIAYATGDGARALVSQRVPC